MKILIRWNDKWITQYVSTINWSGSATQCSRSLSISVINNPYDKNIKPPKIELGDFLYLYADKERLFVGTVMNRERAGDIGTITITAMDAMHHLLRSNGTYSFKNKTPETITKMVCNDLQIKTGEIATTKMNIPKLLIDTESYYNIILKAYTKAKKQTGKKYMLVMDGLKLCVKEKGKWCGVTLTQSTNITQSSFSDSLESMVNKIIIKNEKGKQVGIESNAGWVKKYGVYQDIYTKEEKVNATTAAKNMLSGIEQSASVEALGDIRCVSGVAIKIKDDATKLVGAFWIETDTHTWECGIYKMSLELAFKNVMENVGEDTAGKGSSSDRSTDVSDLRNRIVDVAEKEIGTKETGDNKTKYGDWYGMNGVSWCVIFISWCAYKAGVQTSIIPKMASVGNVLAYAKKQGKYKSKESGYEPKAGDIMIQKSNGTSHVGIVIGSNNKRFTTIEGNASNQVKKISHGYDIKSLTGFFVPGY